jgi:hypothetical protein
MIYNVRINKRVKYIRIYTVLKHVRGGQNMLTKLFARVFAGKNKD